MREDGRCDAEVKARMAMAKEVFHKRKELLNQRMDRRLKKQIIKSVV